MELTIAYHSSKEGNWSTFRGVCNNLNISAYILYIYEYTYLTKTGKKRVKQTKAILNVLFFCAYLKFILNHIYFVAHMEKINCLQRGEQNSINELEKGGRNSIKSIFRPNNNTKHNVEEFSKSVSHKVLEILQSLFESSAQKWYLALRPEFNSQN